MVLCFISILLVSSICNRLHIYINYDADIKTEPIQVRGPMTRSRAKQIKEDMENLVSQASQEGESVKSPQHNRELVLLIQVTQDC